LILFQNVFVIFTIFDNSHYSNTKINEDDTKFPKTSSNGDRTGKEFTTLSRSSTNCHINRDQPSLNVQPNLFLPNHYLFHADMTFEDIFAHNYTRTIESEPSEFYFSSTKGPVYVYQKFSVEIDMYVNNVSILIQDISNPFNDSPDRFWEVAIVNCSNDFYGTPNPNITLGKLEKAPPINFAAHWELFDFENEGNGPIFLNTSLTNSTWENGLEKFWFALKIKIPPNDFGSEDNPKFLYFNQDGGDPSNIGEGETFAESPEFIFANYTTNYVVENKTEIGKWVKGNLDSFKYFNDSDRYLSNDASHLLNITTKFELNDLKSSLYNYTELMFLLTFDKNFLNLWWGEHYRYIYKINLNLATNISKNDLMNATLLAWTQGYLFGFGPQWINMSDFFDIDFNINQTSEDSITYILDDPLQKFLFLTLLNGPGNNFRNPDNSLLFQFFYSGTHSYNYNVSIDQFTIDIGELEPIEEIQKHDPRIQRLYYVNNTAIFNNSNVYGSQSVDALRSIDNNYFKAQAETNNLSIEFKTIVIPELNESLWKGLDIYEWISTYPNPIIPQVDVRVTSNISIANRADLNYSVLEIYKGDKEISFFSDDLNELEWIPISGDKDFAVKTETTITIPVDAGWTWLMLQFMNDSERSIRLRLRYVGNYTFENFNVSINEFRLIFYIQNAINSDIASKLGMGLYSPTLKPEDIEMKNFGTTISNHGDQTGFWSEFITDGVPTLNIFEFNVSSLWHAISFNVSGFYEIYKFEVDLDFEDDFEPYYQIGTNYFSVEATDGSEDPIEDLEITFELLDVDGKVVDEDTAITNDEGIAKASLKFDEVGDGYKIKVSYDKEGIYASEDIKSEEFRIVDDFILFMDSFLAWLPYILIGLAALITFITVRHYRMNKLRAQWAREALTLDDLLKISYILIIHKEAGVTIYSKQISMELDSDLIGGFLTAISQFKAELKKDTTIKTGEKGFEMDYYDFKIVITDGDYVRVALILDGTPSERLKEHQWEFNRRFEARFAPNLKDYGGDIRPFAETDDLIDRVFDIKLMYPLQLAKHWEFTKLNKLEKALIEVGEQMQKERKFIYASSLLSYGLAGRKASRDQIIYTILDLKRRGILIPVELE
jgi:hypothetical protein